MTHSQNKIISYKLCDINKKFGQGHGNWHCVIELDGVCLHADLKHLTATASESKDFFLSQLLISWCFEPSRPQKITSGNKCQSISYLFFTQVMKPQKSSKSTKLVSTQIKTKTCKQLLQICKEIVDQILPLLKKHIIKARTCWYCGLSSDLPIPD